MARLTWLPAARNDLRQVRRFIARDSPDRARAMVERIQSAVERLKDLPASGRVVPEISDTTLREVIVPPYRVVDRYAPDQDLVQVIAVTHSRRMLPAGDDGASRDHEHDRTDV